MVPLTCPLGEGEDSASLFVHSVQAANGIVGFHDVAYDKLLDHKAQSDLIGDEAGGQ